ncbi:MAG: DUF1156 domain-containing protein [Gammaproteobacteria bacterium]|nr:DUF1156 domain-containing protein [Gammaproteobacteria bacterium]MDE0271538.1 DUF1156 domain-containing protein [Gammaproteobacteria bacterium]
MSPRLIESAFPLRQASLDSVHEKNVRHGHISTLHIWPARRPLAASRAVLLATLFPDPGNQRDREALLQRIGGTVVKRNTAKGEKEETEDGVLHWGRESSPDLTALRKEIREAFGGRAPRVLDPFAGGGAIPLEAMRLGCEVTASDLNPVAWFILRCTLHYPRLMAGQTLPLPDFALRDRDFMQAFFKAHNCSKAQVLRSHMARLGHGDGRAVQVSSLDTDEPEQQASFSWHLRAWGRRVLDRARRELASKYPTYAEFEPVKRKGRRGGETLPPRRFKPRPAQMLVPDAEGRVSTASLNSEFDSLYLEDDRNPRWIAKPTVAYLWARTAQCGNCRAEIPLLKTRWLCKRDGKQVLLSMHKAHLGVEFGVETDIPDGADDALGAGTMSKSGVKCPCCDGQAKMEDLRSQGLGGRLGSQMIAVVVEGQRGKEYRTPRQEEIDAAAIGSADLDALFGSIPFGSIDEPTPKAGIGASRAFSVDGYGISKWNQLYTPRQLFALGTIAQEIRSSSSQISGYSEDWQHSLIAGLCCGFNKLTDYSSAACAWHKGRETIGHTFARFALPMVWDYCEANPISDTTGSFSGMLDWVARYFDHALDATGSSPFPAVTRHSATNVSGEGFDLICTDPPYYDAIPYSDLMDFFYVWLRRTLHGLSSETDAAFATPLGPKWDVEANDGELIDDASRFDGDQQASKQNYEDGMARAFGQFHTALRDQGRLVIVFANKQPDAWETLVSALIRAGFVVTGSWPIQTEMQNRQRSLSSAALSSSIWLVCRKRPATARAGWDSRVLAEMRDNITQRLRDFWDAGIRGPDFVWAATGPALEAFSRHPVVKITDQAGRQMTVSDFLRRVRRMVVGFVVSRLVDPEGSDTEELDDLTTYYLLHRNDFGLEPAPAGACILYALSCNIADADLAGRLDLLVRGGRKSASSDAEENPESSSGSEVRLKRWNRRRNRDLGEPSSDGSPPALIDCLHKLMHLWKTGEQAYVDRYLEQRGLWRHELFAHVTQAVIELSERGSEERATLESIQNHLRGSAEPPARPQGNLELTSNA